MIKNRFRIAVNSTTGMMGFRLLVMSFRGIFAATYSRASRPMLSARPRGLEAANNTTMYSTVTSSFMRGSIRCTTELPGKCWPMVMSLSILRPPSWLPVP